MSPRTERALLAVIVVLAFGLRLAYVLALRESPYFDRPILDPAYHVEWARAFAAGRTFEPGPFFRAPLYPWMLGSVFALFGDGLLAPRLLQCLLGAATTLLTWAVARRAFGPREGLLAAACAATYWVLIYFDGELLLPSLVVPLYLAALHASLGLRGAPGPRRLVAAGILWGLGTIARPNVLLFAPVLAGWLVLGQRPRARGLRAAALFAAGWLAPVLPITAYNAVVGGELVLVSTQAGVNLYIGNHPGADGTTASVPGTRGGDFRATHVEARSLAEREAGRTLTPGQVSRRYGARAWDFLLHDPARSLPLLARKLVLFWSDDEVGNNQPVRHTALHFGPWMRFTSIGFGLLAPFGLLGLALSLRRRELLPLWGFVPVYCASVVLFFVNSRFRVPLLPVLMVLGAHALVWGLDRWRARARGSLGVALLAVAALAVALIATRPDRDLERARGLSHLAVGYDLAGDTATARRLHREALALAPGDATLRLAHAAHLDGDGDPRAALSEVRAVLSDDTDHLAGLERLFDLLLRSRRHAELLSEAEAVLTRARGLASAHYHRGAALVGLDRRGEAVDAFEQARRLDSAGSRAQTVLGQLYLAADREQEALVVLEEAVRNDHFPAARTQRVRAHVELARLLARRGDGARAREVARLLVRREPDSPQALALLREMGESDH